MGPSATREGRVDAGAKSPRRASRVVISPRACSTRPFTDRRGPQATRKQTVKRARPASSLAEQAFVMLSATRGPLAGSRDFFFASRNRHGDVVRILKRKRIQQVRNPTLRGQGSKPQTRFHPSVENHPDRTPSQFSSQISWDRDIIFSAGEEKKNPSSRTGRRKSRRSDMKATRRQTESRRKLAT